MTSRHGTVDAVGTVERLPDAATVELRAIGDGNSASDARADAREQSAALRDRLDALQTDGVRAVSIEVEASGDMFDPVTDAAFQATEQLHVDCAPAAVEAVVVEATDAGASVQNVSFGLRAATRETLTDEALTAAMERAREKAEQLAATEGLAVAGVHEVTTTDASEGFQGIVDEALQFDEETNLHPGPITVSEGVEVTYELTEA
jgi:hypothetical protein